jgi:hypothetical protein
VRQKYNHPSDIRGSFRSASQSCSSRPNLWWFPRPCQKSESRRLRNSTPVSVGILVREHALEADRLLNMKPLEVAKFGVILKLSEGRRGAINGMLAEAPSLLRIEEVGALYTLISRVVHWAPSPDHSLRRAWCFPLCVAAPAAAVPASLLPRWRRKFGGNHRS